MHWIDPDSLKPLKSRVERFLYNPKGEADGMLLSNGLEAHFPPHLSGKVLKAIQLGEAVTLYGVKPRATEMLACIALESTHGTRIDDVGPPPKKAKRPKKDNDAHSQGLKPLDIEDSVDRLLHGPKGEVRDVLLSRGSIVRFPSHVADSVRHLLAPRAALAVRGNARVVSGTTVIEAKALGKSVAALRSVAPKPQHA
jgi:hypothetical protein